MPRQAALVYTPGFSEYDLGPSHPLKPIRVARTYDLIRSCGLLRGRSVAVVEPQAAGEDAIALIHTRAYVEAVRAASAGRTERRFLDYGLGTGDNPIIDGMYEASALISGASIQAADLVVDGKAEVAFNPAGGLHHAHRARASGFCVFNDPAIAIAHVLKKCGDGVRVAYIDIDAHHGDGVQEAFYRRKDVLTISIHESGRYLFPTTGSVDEIGEGDGKGYAVNLPLSPYTGDEAYVWAFKEIVPPLIGAFQPDFICTQLGADTHFQDPLTHLCCTTRGYIAVIQEIADLVGARSSAPSTSDGLRGWIALGGGGYDITVVPRAWTLAFACMAGKKAPAFIPEDQLAHYRVGGASSPRRAVGTPPLVGAHGDAPPVKGDHSNSASDANRVPLHDAHPPKTDDDWLRVSREFAEESAKEIKEKVFPYHGL